jgi:signal transduction protein with GAF and PtsI domain
MQTERVTILMTPARKAKVASRAAARGISMGEYLRRKVEDDDDEVTPEQEAELEELIRQVNIAIPEMAASLDEMSAMLRSTNEEIDRTLREAGLRA